MATAFTSGASLHPSARNTNPWEPETTHGEPEDTHGNFDDDDPTAYEPLSEADAESHTTGHINGDANTNGTTAGHLNPPSPAFPPRRSSLLPDPARAPFPIALRASFLSLTLGLSLLTTLFLLHQQSPYWRLPFFASTLCLFHLLEFFTTALYNPIGTTVSSFLLDNGRAYNVAHGAAFLECFARFGFFPAQEWLTWTTSPAWIALGVVMMVIGQSVRSIAMAHAGSNFNHIVQQRKTDGHQLVTDGIYAYLRHPSYFGFFWWSLGTQVVLGNVVCLVGFAVVLRRFFARRVRREEELLVGFFGEGYLAYRGRTGVWIPFVG